MQKIYLLLRSNKQSGPFSLPELAQLQLKPSDLVWVEGKSAGWRNPQEIDELSSFVPEAAARIQRTSLPPEKPVEKPVQAIPAAPDFPAGKPVRPPTAIHVSFPYGKTPAPAVSVPAVPEEPSPEEKLKQKADELYQKIQAYNAGQAQPAESRALNTKYSRSLDDIKEEYSEWMHHQKEKKPAGFQLPARAAAITAVLLGLAFTVYQLYGNHPAPALNGPAAATTMAVPQTAREELPATADEPVVQPASEENLPDAEPKEDAQIPEVRQQGVPKQKTAPEKQVPPSTTDAPVPTNEAVVTDEPPAATPPDPVTGTRTRQVRKDPAPGENGGSSESGEATPPAKKAKEDAATIARQIQLSEKYINSDGQGIHGLQLTVYNNSDHFVNVVAVDVFYYRNEDKLLKKETLYFNNIPPKSRSSMPAPDNRRASSVKYQLGLISTEAGLFYAKQ